MALGLAGLFLYWGWNFPSDWEARQHGFYHGRRAAIGRPVFGALGLLPLPLRWPVAFSLFAALALLIGLIGTALLWRYVDGWSVVATRAGLRFHPSYFAPQLIPWSDIREISATQDDRSSRDAKPRLRVELIQPIRWMISMRASTIIIAETAFVEEVETFVTTCHQLKAAAETGGASSCLEPVFGRAGPT